MSHEIPKTSELVIPIQTDVGMAQVCIQVENIHYAPPRLLWGILELAQSFIAPHCPTDSGETPETIPNSILKAFEGDEDGNAPAG